MLAVEFVKQGGAPSISRRNAREEGEGHSSESLHPQTPVLPDVSL